MLVAAPAGPALCDNDARVRLREVGDKLVAVEYLRPDRNTEHGVLPARPVRETTAACPATAAADLLVRPEPGEVAATRVRHEYDVAAFSAVAPVGSATRHVLLPAEVDGTVAAAARDGRQARAVVEHGLLGVDDRDEALLAARPEGDPAVAHREDRVVLADTRASAGPEPRAALADEDHPRRHVLPGEELHAEHLRIGVAAVPRRAESLFVCHYCFSSSADSSAARAPLRALPERSCSSAASTCSRLQPAAASESCAIVIDA